MTNNDGNNGQQRTPTMAAYNALKEDVQCVAPPHYTTTNQKRWQGGDGGNDDSENVDNKRQ